MDAFAQIAQNGIQGRRELLEQPVPPPLPDLLVPLEKTWEEPAILPQKIRTAAQLLEALTDMRRQMQPFLENYAPMLESCRQILRLEQFRYRLEGKDVWETVSIPHYGGPLGPATAFYETEFTLKDVSRRVFAVVNGADYRAQVYVNGRLAGTHEGFFASFEFDITRLAHPGENRLTICLENDYIMMGSRSDEDPRNFCGDKIYAATGPGYDDPALGWHHCPPGMGLLDSVEIQVRESVFLQSAFARTLEDEMEFWVEVGSCGYEPRPIRLELSVYGQNCRQTVVEHLRLEPTTGKEVGLGDTYTEVLARREGTLHARLPLPCAKGRNLYKVRLTAAELAFWTPETPWLYQLQLRLFDENGTLLDTLAQQFGRRTFTQDTAGEIKGMFYLNGQSIRLRGANTMGFEQQDVMQGREEQLINDIILAKLCHMNFLRITQRPVQRQVYEYCDRLGMMVQTDLPLFGCVRRQQFCEVVRQAEEMERHIRAHASCVLISYINEPFPNANNLPSMNLERPELEQLFRAADIAVRLNNPDRVIKYIDGDYDPPSETMPDNHCYPMWYNGHGIDIGMLHKGYWMPVKPGWYYGCGEFGCEGLEDWELMQAAYPSDWLVHPGEVETDWNPARIVRAQTADFYHFFYDRQATPRDWVRESQAFQALATRMMTEAFRRDTRMVSFAIHLFIDAFPSGWMKAIMDCRRTPKPAYFAYRDALEPLLLSLRADKRSFFGGETARAEGWICNDTARTGPVQLRYELLCGGNVIAAAVREAVLEANCAWCHSVAEFLLPAVQTRTTVQLRAMIMDGMTCLAWNSLEYTLLPPCEELPTIRVCSIDQVTSADLAAVEQGEILWIDKPKAGHYTLGPWTVEVRESGMAPMHFVSAQTGHPWAADFQQPDFRHWYDSETDRISPLADCTVEAAGFAPVLVSRNTTPHGWRDAAVLCERAYGAGRVILSQIAWRQMLDNPAGRILISRISSADSSSL